MAKADARFRQSKSRHKPYKLADEAGLYLLVTPGGSKLWRWKYRHAGKEKLLALGAYPVVSLSEARRARDDARRELTAGLDPSLEKQARRARTMQRASNTFDAVARAWLADWSVGKSEKHASDVKRRIETDLMPALGKLPVADVTARYVLAAAKAVERRGALVMARRVVQYAGAIMRYAVRVGLADRNPAVDLRGALKARKERHYARVEAAELPDLLRAIESYRGTIWVRAALRLMPLTFVRTSELIEAEWSEFDLDAGIWRIPAIRMKMDAPHLVPLSRQAVAILRELQPVTAHRTHLFPNERDHGKPMSNGALLMALRRMGFRGRMTGHGFRGIASTLLHELGYPHSHIEVQLAHQERSEVSRAYNAAMYLKARTAMMQAWADYLDGLRQGGRLIPIGLAA